jgi:hypothetical protein
VSEPLKDQSPDSVPEVWEQGWEGHRRLQLERLGRLPLPLKLAWLEEAHRLVLHMQSEQSGSRKRD